MSTYIYFLLPDYRQYLFCYQFPLIMLRATDQRDNLRSDRGEGEGEVEHTLLGLRSTQDTPSSA